MPPLRVAPYREIAHEISARLAAAHAGDPLAPWAEEVLVPSRGMADAIAENLLAIRPEGVAGLRLQTLDELAQRMLVAAGRNQRVATDAERRLAMRTAIRSIDHPMMESRGVASMLERAYRDVRDSAVSLQDVTRRMRGARLRNRARTEAIVAAWTEYERLIAQLDAVDAADRLAAAARLASSCPVPQLLAGFYDMTGAQRQFAEALLRADRVARIWVPTDAPFAQPFLESLQPFVEVVRDPAVEARHPRVDAAQYDTGASELQDVCARIAQLLSDGTPAREIGIVGRSLDPHGVSLLNRAARERGFATTMSDEMPLIAHRIGRGAVSLMRIRERGFPRGEVLELVRDGLRVKTPVDVDAVDAATRRARVAGGTSDELLKMRSRSREVDDYIALVSELEELTAEAPPRLVARLGSLFRIETDADLAAAGRLDEIAAVFARAAVWRKGLDLTAVIDAIEQETLPASKKPDASLPVVWAGEVLRFRGRSFTHLFVVRMQDDVFPQRRVEDPLLPDTDRRTLGIRVIGDGRAEESLLFSLLADSAPNVHYSFAIGDGFGKVLRPSRYLRGIATRVDAPQSHAQSSLSNAPRRPLQLLARAGTRSVFDGYIGPLGDTLREKLQSLSPTQLEDFGECPQKFLLKHLLGVVDIDHPERELQINPRDKGTADHRILERFYRATTEDDLARAAAVLPDLPRELIDRLETLVDEQFDEMENAVPPFNRTVRGIERRATKRLLREFVAADIADLDAQRLTPRWFEYRFGRKHREADHPEPFVVETGAVPIRVEGTIDRVDTGEGRLRIVDYKSGKAMRHAGLGAKIDHGVRLQLALYAMAAAEFFETDPERVSGTIKPLVAGDAKPEKFAFALHEKREEVLKTLHIFIRAIVEGRFPAFPNENDQEFNSCKYCPVNHSCRTKHDVDERYAVSRFEDPRSLLGDSE